MKVPILLPTGQLVVAFLSQLSRFDGGVVSAEFRTKKEKRMPRLNSIVVVVCLLVANADAAAPFQTRSGLFNNKRPADLGLPVMDGKHTSLYRADRNPYKFCHHPNLVVYRDQLFCMWSNGIKDEDAPGQRILLCSTRDGAKWTTAAELTNANNRKGICVAAGFHVGKNGLVAYYTITGGKNFHAQTALFARTSQNGVTWGKPQRLFSGFYIEGPRRLPNGDLLMAGEQVDPNRKTGRMKILTTKDPNGLAGWKESAFPKLQNAKVFGYSEPGMFFAGGKVTMTFRNYSGFLFASTSNNNGRSWTHPVKTNFPDSTARLAAGNLSDGSVYMINNPMPTRFDRSLLVLTHSRDGKTFDRAWRIRAKQAKKRFDGKHKLDGWQYPHAVTWKGQLFVAYSINKEDVSVTRIPISAIVGTRKLAARLVKQQKLAKGAANQGMAIGEKHIFTANAHDICRYDKNWNFIEQKKIRIPKVNHLGAIDYHKGFIWAGLLHGPVGNKYDKKKDRSIIAKIRASDLKVVKTWDITTDLTWIDPVCFDGKHLWVGDLRNLGIHRYRIAGDKLINTGALRYPSAMHFSQGVRVRGNKLYSIHTFGSRDGLFEFTLPKKLSKTVQQPTRVWAIQETKMHLEGFAFIPGHPGQIWHVQGSQVDRYQLSGFK